MATVTINNSPIHSTSIITYPFGIADSGYSCGWHTGIDFAPYGATESNPYLYSVCSGEVVEVNLTPTRALGNNVVIKEDVTGNYWRFCHMVTGSVQVIQGQRITTNTIIGRMGATGNVTGIHLHLEYASTQRWQCSTFLNPANALGIPNVDNTIVEYSGTPPIPPAPTARTKKKKFPWFIYWRRRF